MNKLTNIPNKIKQSAQCCVHCGKGYKTRLNLEKHVVLCELVHKSKRISMNDDEEHELPSQKKMFQMLLELGKKYSDLEEKVDEINKWVIKKKKKINVLEYLNANIVPNLIFENLVDKIAIIESDMEFLLQNSFLDTINEVFARTIYNISETENPIFTFAQKANVFYIYDINGINKINNDINNDENNKPVWLELPKDKLIRFLNKMQMKISKCFYEWRKKNAEKIRDNDSLSISCDSSVLKIMSTEFKQDATLSKMKTIMYNKMKTDMKALIEYEFEF
jgi:hypothetical protein